MISTVASMYRVGSKKVPFLFLH